MTVNDMRKLEIFNKNHVPFTSDELAEEVWKALFGLGPIPEHLAMSQASKRLSDSHMMPLRTIDTDAEAEHLVREALDVAVDYAFLDEPRPGFVRAVLKDPNDYEPEDWRKCILSSMDEGPMKREDVVWNAVIWARENLGLGIGRIEKGDGVWQCVETELNEMIHEKVVKQTVFYGIERLQMMQ
jgi:hypothetical protein